MYCLDERGIIEKPYQTPGNMSRKKGFVIVVQQLYKWKYLPVAKVLFCDCQHFADMLRNKSEGAQMELMRSFWSASWLHLVDRIVADQQVSAIPGLFVLKESGPGTWLHMSFYSRKDELNWKKSSRVFVFSYSVIFCCSTFEHTT